MDARKIIYDRFIQPFEDKVTGKFIGVELEFPLINKQCADIDPEIAHGILYQMQKCGFSAVISGDGVPLFIENADGDGLSFDNSYNNFEFAMMYSDDLTKIAKRFYVLKEMVDEYFAPHGYELVGRGTNPNKAYITQNPIGYNTYKMVDEYLHKFPGEHNYPDFPAYLSSVQTHLDVSLHDLPRAFTLFAALDFVSALLFSNSPDFEGRGYRCYRDELWEKSGFSNCPGITGKVDGEFATANDLVDHFMQKGMFNRIRNGKYETFAPVPIGTYFEDPAHGAKESDVFQYLSFQSIELTSRGTLEVRGDCAQPFDKAFAPPAFHLGVLANLDAAEDCLKTFKNEHNVKGTNTHLRDIVVTGRPLCEIAPEGAIEKLKRDMTDIAKEGLLRRGKGEETLL